HSKERRNFRCRIGVQSGKGAVVPSAAASADHKLRIVPPPRADLLGGISDFEQGSSRWPSHCVSLLPDCYSRAPSRPMRKSWVRFWFECSNRPRNPCLPGRHLLRKGFRLEHPTAYRPDEPDSCPIIPLRRT